MIDVAVIGGGIVGLAVAHALVESAPALAVVVLEKERDFALHQTGRNSGVIHAGLYYRPGSRKAQMVASGRRRLMAFCDENGVPYEVCGKVVVATDAAEVERLGILAERAAANGVNVSHLGPSELREIEPYARGVAALRVPSTGIVDFRRVAGAMAERLRSAGATLSFGARVEGFRTGSRSVVLATTQGEVEARCVVNCGGLHADRIARWAGAATDLRIVPFRGEYYELEAGREHLVKHLLYPVPDPQFPFLGVHFTRSIGGGIHAGPNAVPAFAREGYSWSKVEAREVGELLRFSGVRKLARRHWRTELGEVHRSLSRRAFARALQRLVPDVTAADLRPAAAGVRAQAVAPDGTLLDDFAFAESPRFLHVLNAPSPAATASLEIGDTIARRIPALL